MKVGDKVRVRKDLKVNHLYNGVRFTGRMTQYRGQIKTITNISVDYEKAFLLDNNNRYLWTLDMVKPVKDDVKLIFNGNATILFKDGKKYVTKCDEDDIYDREKGLLIVLAKANGYTYNDMQEILNNATIKSKPNTDNSQVLIAQLVKEIEKLKQEKHDWEWYSQDLEREVEELKC